MTTKDSIENFLSSKSYAVVGVSRKQSKFGTVIYNELKKKGLDVYGVNPNMEVIEGEKCYHSLKELGDHVDAVINVVSPSQTLAIAQEANEIGVKNFWMQQGSESNEAIEYCKENGINEVHKECILMFAEPVKSFHGFHRWIWKILGKLPG
jgi:predicted CoA-binding protein